MGPTLFTNSHSYIRTRYYPPLHAQSTDNDDMARSQLILASLAAGAVQYASATLGVTYPVASTVCRGGQACGPFEWQGDDSVAPPAADFGRSTVGIYTGTVNAQTLFLDLGTLSDPTSITDIEATTIPATLGPNGDFYFLRIESVDGTDPDTGFPLQAFSAMFTLTGMRGELTGPAQAQIDGIALASATSTVASRGPVTTKPTSSATNGIGANAATKSAASGVAAASGSLVASKNDTGSAGPRFAGYGYVATVGAGLVALAALFA